MRKKISLILAPLFALVLPAALSVGQQTSTQPGGAPKPTTRPAAARNRVAGFVADSLDGEQIRFPEGYQGKVVLEIFWATWCPKCKAEIPFWREAYKQYHDQGFEIVSIATDKNRRTAGAVVAEFAKKNELTWPVIYDDATELAGVYEIQTVPTIYLVDGDTGEILAERAAVRKERLAPSIELALQNKGLLKTPTSQPADKR